MLKKHTYFFIFLVLITWIAGCSEKKEETLIIKFKNKQQSFEIIEAYKLYPDYFKAADGQPANKKEELYQSKIIQPVYNSCFKDAEYPYMDDNLINNPPEQTAKKTLSSTDSKELISSIKEALMKSSEYLPGKKKTSVCIFPPQENNQDNAVTVGAGKIIYSARPSNSPDRIKTVIAHEYHHSVWTELYAYPSTSLLDNLVFEGKAVMFEKMVFPNLKGMYVNTAYQTAYWDQIKNDLDNPDLNKSFEVLFGGNGLPLLYGYSEGYKMVENYIKKYKVDNIKTWTKMSAREIFEKGEYEKNYSH
ncbi:DUF2268 domain-containing putative Zn-dependent protease [Peribacillus deserti]|uniref:Zn-dependent protease n=1 Tax=Peribacillus deserti TaxID=673318 RepID=A0A2N5M4J6_9BACI|nr:DUF2268 domain-containing putative Zn-dependent protease [Peribacillus deserti]PLT29277.1 Zn-dependent protease [Peribacillus deserti]